MKKTIIKTIFIICFIAIAIFSLQKISLTKDEVTSVPEFYGTVGINLRVGDTLDLKNSMFRIFAKDYYDGDLTNNIKIIENNVNTKKAGKYYIVYSVKNSKEVETKIEVPVSITSNGERTIIRKIYKLNTAYGGENVSLNADYHAGRIGIEHDRQHLGIFTKAGAILKIRPVQGTFDSNNKVKIDIINQYKNRDLGTVGIEINDGWNQIEITTDSVPFINTPNSKEDINQQVEVSIEDVYEEESKTKELTYYLYNKDDKGENFLQKWRTNEDAFTVMESDTVTFLVPYEDFSMMENIIKGYEQKNIKYPFNSLGDLFIYYKSVFEFNDKLIGISLEAKEEIDKKEIIKYFIKPEEDGAGAAFYSREYCANSYNIGKTCTIAPYLNRSWTVVHEIGHGYEGDIGRNDIDLQEVQNNIFAYYMQISYLNEDDFGWMGDISVQEETYNTERKSLLETEVFNDLKNKAKDHHHTRLYMMTNLLNKVGVEKGMSTLYKNSRRDHLSNGGKAKEADLIAKSFSEASGYDVIPYLESWKVNISQEVKDEIQNKNYPIIYYLRELVSQTNAEKIKNNLGLEGVYSLVSNNDINEYITNNNITGMVTIPFDQRFYDMYTSDKIVLKSETEEIISVLANNSATKVTVPVGIYRIEFTNKNNVLQQKYVVVRENNDSTISLEMKLRDFKHRVDENGNAIITEYLGNSEEVEIPSYIYNHKVIGIDKEVFKDNTTLKKIKIPTTIERIEMYAFNGCTSLTEIDLSNVTYIGAGAFARCTSLTQVDLSNVTYLGSLAFRYCESLKSIGSLKNTTYIKPQAFLRM